MGTLAKIGCDGNNQFEILICILVLDLARLCSCIILTVLLCHYRSIVFLEFEHRQIITDGLNFFLYFEFLT